MSERMYQGIIGVLVLIILVGGAIMLGSRSSSSVTSGAGGNEAASTSGASLATRENAVSGSSDVVKAGDSAVSKAPLQNTAVAAGSDAVSVEDQAATSSVVVKSVTISKLGWVAVRENGWILGAARLEAGTYSDVTIPLLRNTKAGSSYEAVLYYDDGDMLFDLHKDTIVVRADGSDLAAAFLAK